MARSTNQKLKILYIIRLLAGTDEAHVATMADILEELKSRGISAERKSIYDDIAALRSFGLDIVNRRERPAGYYLRDKASLSAVGMAPAAEDSERSGPAGETESAAGLSLSDGGNLVLEQLRHGPRQGRRMQNPRPVHPERKTRRLLRHCRQSYADLRTGRNVPQRVYAQTAGRAVGD